ncbi:MAG: hypothetical protein WD737_11530 [Gemmatimonadota bacterium]
MAGSSRQELKDRIDAIEESYEFMLAYAAQGLSTDQASKSGAQLREFLGRTQDALGRLTDLFEAVVQEEGLGSDPAYADFIEVLRADAHKASAAVRLTLAQPAIGSQLVDNLNASIHLRALLTDIFLLDEVIEPRSTASAST